MAKYTDKQLKNMATIVMADYQSGGFQAIMVIVAVSQQTGLSHQDVVNRIQHYANMEVT